MGGFERAGILAVEDIEFTGPIWTRAVATITTVVAAGFCVEGWVTDAVGWQRHAVFWLWALWEEFSEVVEALTVYTEVLVAAKL